MRAVRGGARADDRREERRRDTGAARCARAGGAFRGEADARADDRADGGHPGAAQQDRLPGRARPPPTVALRAAHRHTAAVATPSCDMRASAGGPEPTYDQPSRNRTVLALDWKVTHAHTRH